MLPAPCFLLVAFVVLVRGTKVPPEDRSPRCEEGQTRRADAGSWGRQSSLSAGSPRSQARSCRRSVFSTPGCSLCSAAKGATAARAEPPGPTSLTPVQGSTQPMNCCSVDSPGPWGDPQTTLCWALRRRSAPPGAAGVAALPGCAFLSACCADPRGVGRQSRAVPGDAPAAPTPCGAPQSSATAPLGICEATFDLNGVEEQPAVDRAGAQVSRTRRTAKRGSTAIQPVWRQNKPKQPEQRHIQTWQPVHCHSHQLPVQTQQFNHEATSQPTCSSFAFLFRTIGAGVVSLTVSCFILLP